ncbi:Glucose and ribitol dehydrogenase [Linum perenne]
MLNSFLLFLYICWIPTLPIPRLCFCFLVMATSSEDKFPPQSQQQQQQPGQEHVMRPLPMPLAPNYKPSDKLLGKVALVTGGDSGIGRSVCLHFALEGATVAFTYIKGVEDKDKDDTLVMLLEAKTIGAKDPLAIAADIGFDDNFRKLVDLVVNEYGRIDILVNNAAEQHLTRSVEEITESRLERVFRTNIFSHFFLARRSFCVRHALKHMNEGSSIINSTSVNAYNGGSEVLDYTATKGAIVAFTRGLALQLVNKGIRVNAVAPGPVWTPLQPASMPPDSIKKLGSSVPMGRAAQPHEIAPCYVFLACNQCSSYFTGQVLHPNGGMIVNA